MAKTKQEQIREAAEADLLTFIKLVAPQRMVGRIHEDLCRWWTRAEAKDHQLVLLPRGHQKSTLVAYRAAWEITRDPSITILYVSSTSNLAEKQLDLIKSVLDSPVYRRYWPDMTNEQEGKRARWSNTEIIVDHPKRAAEQVRDPTVFTAGLTTSVTGMHCDIAIYDDMVEPRNAYTHDGRSKVKQAYSFLSSIENPGTKEWVVGTRYFPTDLYRDLMDMVEEESDVDGNIIESASVFELFEEKVEDIGDGTGNFLWPRTQRADGRWFGFNAKVLATKKAQYLDRTHFFSQYYNNPNDPENEAIPKSTFQYYDKHFVKRTMGKWFFQDKPLNVFGAIDFAFSTKARADYTCLVVVGIDPDGNIYVLDIDRFKTNKILDYFDAISRAHVKWDVRRIAAETSVAQVAIVEDIKAKIREYGLALSIKSVLPTRSGGTKQERVRACLQPRYENGTMWHFRGGAIDDLELELVQQNPTHDDIKDALTMAVDIAVPPTAAHNRLRTDNVVYNSRFGGVSFGH